MILFIVFKYGRERGIKKQIVQSSCIIQSLAQNNISTAAYSLHDFPKSYAETKLCSFPSAKAKRKALSEPLASAPKRGRGRGRGRGQKAGSWQQEFAQGSL